MNKIFIVKDIFEISAPLNDDLIRFSKTNIGEGVPFVARSSRNNGVTCFVKERKGYINHANQITIALDGSSGSTFFHSYPFSAGQNLWILKPKTKIKLTEKGNLYLVSIFNKLTGLSSYAVNLTKTRLMEKRIELPVKNDCVDWEGINTQSEKKEYKLVKKLKELNVNLDKDKIFKKFKLSKLFEEIFYPKNYRISSFEITPRPTRNNVIPFVSAKGTNNGVAGFLAHQTGLVTYKNLITVSNNGTIGFAQYRDYSFIGNNDITCLSSPNFVMTKTIALFICSSIRQTAMNQYSYGNKLKGEKMANLQISLPVTENGEIDLEYMDKAINI